MFPFKKPNGPRADLKELEYISAIQQTSLPSLRSNCTISSTDISLYLRSRYGLKIDHEDALDIVRGLGGTESSSRKKDVLSNVGQDLTVNDTNLDHESEQQKENNFDFQEEYIDLVQYMSILLIPTLRRTCHSILVEDYKNNEVRKGDTSGTISMDLIVKDVLRILLMNVSNDADQNSIINHYNHSPPAYSCVYEENHLSVQQDKSDIENNHLTENKLEDPILTVDLMKQILLSYGEYEVASNDELLKEMIECCRCSSSDDDELDETIKNTDDKTVYLSEKSFSRALISDIMEWSVGKEDTDFTTPFQDVFGVHPIDLWKEEGISHNTGSREISNHHNTDKLNEIDGTKPTDNPTFYQDDTFYPTKSEHLDKRMDSTGIQNVDHDTSFHDDQHFNQDAFSYSSDSNNCNNEKQYIKHTDTTITTPAYNGNNTIGTPTFRPTYLFIDYVADTYYSKVYNISLWIYYGFSVGVWLALAKEYNFNYCNLESTFWCLLIDSIVKWILLFVFLALGAMLIICPVSLANHPYTAKLNYDFVAAVALCIFSTIPVIIKNYDTSLGFNASRLFTTACYTYFSFGILLMLLIPIHVIAHSKNSVNQHFLLSNEVTSSAEIKRAATCKVNSLLINAHKTHLWLSGNSCAHLKGGLDVFMHKSDDYETCGGLIWCWKQLLKRDITNVHGIWISTTFVVGQFIQAVTFIIGVTLAVWFIEDYADYVDDKRQEIINSVAEINIRKLLLEWYPEGRIIRISLYTGLGVAIPIGILLILCYFPSTVQTTLKLRCGMIPTMRDIDFFKYRSATDMTYYNLGNMTYGLLGGMILFKVVIGAGVFLILWPITQDLMFLVIAWGLGLSITIGMKTIMTAMCRKRFYSSFYRSRPREANLSALILQCWNIGLGGGVLIGRLTQFLFAACFWIGRIDKSFLHDDVNIMNYRFDYAPINYRKEILSHESHRHPFIDRVGTMYLMRLKSKKHGRIFCRDVGCAWRRIFVHALMPWLKKYRTSALIQDAKSG